MVCCMRPFFTFPSQSMIIVLCFLYCPWSGTSKVSLSLSQKGERWKVQQGEHNRCSRCCPISDAVAWIFEQRNPASQKENKKVSRFVKVVMATPGVFPENLFNVFSKGTICNFPRKQCNKIAIFRANWLPWFEKSQPTRARSASRGKERTDFKICHQNRGGGASIFIANEQARPFFKACQEFMLFLAICVCFLGCKSFL